MTRLLDVAGINLAGAAVPSIPPRKDCGVDEKWFAHRTIARGRRAFWRLAPPQHGQQFRQKVSALNHASIWLASHRDGKMSKIRPALCTCLATVSKDQRAKRHSPDDPGDTITTNSVSAAAKKQTWRRSSAPLYFKKRPCLGGASLCCHLAVPVSHLGGREYAQPIGGQARPHSGLSSGSITALCPPRAWRADRGCDPPLAHD